MTPRRPHGLESDCGGALGERGENPAAVEPTRAVAAEDGVPVDVARLHRRCCRAPTVRAAERRPGTEAALDEVETIANPAPGAVVRQPRDVALVDSALKNQVLEQATDRVVGKRGHDRRPQPEAAAEPPGDVVLAAAL